MTVKQHTIFFLTLLVGCVVLILTLGSPTINYISIVWGFFGFAFNGFLFLKTWINLSKKLVLEHKSELNELKISFHVGQFKQTVDMFALLQNQKKIEIISDDIKRRLSLYRTYFRLTLIALPVFAILGILTVIMTWE